MRTQAATPDAIVAAVAAVQHGVVTFRQLLDAGLTRAGIQRRVAAGRLHRIHRGVYAVGHPGISREGRWRAATLACGPGAALSHRSAAELWRMLDQTDGMPHITVAMKSGRRSSEEIRVHRSRSLTANAITHERRIPVTDPQRTLEDLRRQVTPGVFRRALREAEFRRLPVRRAVLAPDRAGNDLELALLGLCKRFRLPTPETNVPIHGLEVDFLWRAQRLVVETDGYDAHRGSVAFEEDHRRDIRLIARGYFVLRFTYWQVMNEAAEVAAVIRQRLACGGL